MDNEMLELNDEMLDEVAGGTGKLDPKKLTWNKHKTYTVVKGDSLARIANKIGIPWQTLYAHNKQFPNPRLIHVGDKVNIPDQAKI
ncbi:MAG: LysM peptidoglycan-binding domain-containing protein [Clostridia bacterium]|nr:LysM peptidoglycan-binding domain-containing protein [Clostridia bacterium]